MARPTSPTPAFSIVREVVEAETNALVHPGWARAFPWLVQGTTTRASSDGRPFDLGLFAERSDPDAARARWRALRARVGANLVVHAHQVHGADVRVHPVEGVRAGRASLGDEARGDPHLVDPCDGHATATPGVLLGVTTADCVPVFLVDAEREAVAAVHAGWRGTAAGVFERGLSAMTEAFGSRPETIHVHCGPSICGDCYEVGPEVFEALQQPVPDAPTPIDLRRVLAAQAVRAGIRVEAITVSAHCTVCTESALFSHRAGDGERQVGFIGIRR